MMQVRVPVSIVTIEQGAYNAGIDRIREALATRKGRRHGVIVHWLLRTDASLDTFEGELVIFTLKQKDACHWLFTGTFQGCTIEGAINPMTGKGSFSELLPHQS